MNLPGLDIDTDGIQEVGRAADGGGDIAGAPPGELESRYRYRWYPGSWQGRRWW
ncbi:MAG: hypothetical protein GY757_03895 [bacterium]|nr:hypothetical protein [bacterium]